MTGWVSNKDSSKPGIPALVTGFGTESKLFKVSEWSPVLYQANRPLRTEGREHTECFCTAPERSKHSINIKYKLYLY